MGRAQGSRAGLHGLEHGRRLAAAYLADDQSGQVLAECFWHQVRDHEVTDPAAARGLTVAHTSLQRENVLSAALEVCHQLVVGFQGPESLVRWDGADQGPQ